MSRTLRVSRCVRRRACRCAFRISHSPVGSVPGPARSSIHLICFVLTFLFLHFADRVFSCLRLNLVSPVGYPRPLSRSLCERLMEDLQESYETIMGVALKARRERMRDVM